MRKLLLSFLMLIAIVSVNAQTTTINLLTDIYSQNFNSMASTGTTGTVLPTNWYSTLSSYRVSNGAVGNGGLYSFGDSAVTDRALGSIGSSSATPFYGVKFTNNTSSIITTLNISYIVEQWRLGQKPALRLDSTLLSYNIGVDSLNTSGWINVSSLKMSTPDTNNVGGVAADGGFRINGNVSPNRKLVSGSITGISVPIGSTFWLRWSERNVSGTDDGLAVDSLTVAFAGTAIVACTTPTVPTSLVLSPSGNSINGTFTGSGATKYMVVRSTSATLGATPSNGTVYTAGNIFGSGTIVQISSNTSFTSSGLMGSTQYYFFVYALNDVCTGEPFYSTTSLNGNSTTTCGEPNKPTNLTFTNVTNNIITGKFNKSIPAAAGYVVVIGKSTNLGYPNDSTSYTAGDSIINGSFKSKVIYVGADSNFTATGLDSSTRYYIAVIPYANCPGFINYNRGTPLRDDTLTGGTLPTSCFAPDTIVGGVTVGTITNNSISGSVAPVANANGYIVIYRTRSFLAAPSDSITYSIGQLITQVSGNFTDSSYVGYVGTSPNFIINGLNPGTTYYFAVIPYSSCSYGPNYNLKIAASNRGTATTTGGNPSCFAPDTIVGGVTIGTITNNSISGSVAPVANAAGYIVVYRTRSFLVAPRDSITYTVGQLITQVSGNFTDSSYIGYVGTSPNFTINGLNSGTTYYFAVIPYSSCSYGPNYNIKIAASNRGTATTTGGACLAPTSVPQNLVFSTITSNSISGHFKKLSSADGYYILVAKGFITTPRDSNLNVVGDSIGSFSPKTYIAKITSTNVDTNFTITGLQSNTKYSVLIVPYKTCNGFKLFNKNVVPSVNKRDTTTLLSTGIRNNTNQIAIKLFPNPATNIINIEFEKNTVGNTNLTIFDNVGRNVYSESFFINNQFKINLPDLSKGIYIINLENKNFNAVKTFIVE